MCATFALYGLVCNALCMGASPLWFVMRINGCYLSMFTRHIFLAFLMEVPFVTAVRRTALYVLVFDRLMPRFGFCVPPKGVAVS